MRNVLRCTVLERRRRSILPAFRDVVSDSSTWGTVRKHSKAPTERVKQSKSITSAPDLLLLVLKVVKIHRSFTTNTTTTTSTTTSNNLLFKFVRIRSKINTRTLVITKAFILLQKNWKMLFWKTKKKNNILTNFDNLFVFKLKDLNLKTKSLTL